MAAYERALREALEKRGQTLIKAELAPHVLGPQYQVLILTCRGRDGWVSRRGDVFDRVELGDDVFLRLWVECHYAVCRAARGASVRSLLEAPPLADMAASSKGA